MRTWLTTIVMAEPVMKPLMAGAGINSTSHPIRRSPMPRTTKPCADMLDISDMGNEDETHGDESHSGGNLRALPCLMMSLHVLDDLGCGQRHDSDRSDRHILGSGKELRGGD